ncbi:MAG: hypothetical protein ACRD19_17260, partial [Terriglobia bacterium]
ATPSASRPLNQQKQEPTTLRNTKLQNSWDLTPKSAPLDQIAGKCATIDGGNATAKASLVQYIFS